MWKFVFIIIITSDFEGVATKTIEPKLILITFCKNLKFLNRAQQILEIKIVNVKCENLCLL